MPTKSRVYIFRYLCYGQSNHSILVQFCQKKSYKIYFLFSSKSKNKQNVTKKIGFAEDKSQLQSDIDAPL